ncbi:hypothetical protein F5Y10DRAFT_293831 [Nemania abortiva]|nr:hypothetical protein F5Y10DRAFT_293831 [Nemania abortiva]
MQVADSPPAMSASKQLYSEGYCLHVFPFSLYSIMARFTYVLGCQVSIGTSAARPQIDLRLVNLHKDENISEDFLLTVNPKGQVPVLTGGDLSTPITDSLDISYWLCSHFPNMLPDAHKSTIKDLLSQLHGFEGLSLSVPSKADRLRGVPCLAVDDLLSRTDISKGYRRALEYKRKFHSDTQERALEDAVVSNAEGRVQSLFANILLVRCCPDSAEAGTWIFRDATVLDAHLVPLIARLLDCERTDLVPAELQNYALAVMKGPEWQEVTHGRRTTWDISMGHVHLLQKL